MNFAGGRVTGGKISVEIRPPGFDLLDPWNKLAARLDANVFMHPLALNAATETEFAEIHVLVAWEEGELPRRPVGF